MDVFSLFAIIINQCVEWLKIPINFGNGIEITPWIMILITIIVSIICAVLEQIFGKGK